VTCVAQTAPLHLRQLLRHLGIGLIIPILPKLIEQFSGGNASAASHTYGWLARFIR
jgi:hypothetical protein